MEDEDLQRLYVWLDEIPLSRPKRNIARDFSDGVMVAEVVNYFLPRLIDLHNYTPANSSKQKQNNWDTLNRKVFTRFGLTVPENVIKGVIDMKPGVIEVVLNNLRQKIEQFLLKEGHDGDGPAPPVHEEPKLSPIKRSPAPPAAAAPVVHQPVRSIAAAPAPVQAAPKAAPAAQARSPAKPAGAAQGKGKGEGGKDLAQALLEKDQSLMDYQETVEILQVKVRKLEQLVMLKDKRIEELTKKLKQAGVKL